MPRPDPLLLCVAAALLLTWLVMQVEGPSDPVSFTAPSTWVETPGGIAFESARAEQRQHQAQDRARYIRALARAKRKERP